MTKYPLFSGKLLSYKQALYLRERHVTKMKFEFGSPAFGLTEWVNDNAFIVLNPDGMGEWHEGQSKLINLVRTKRPEQEL